MADQPLFPLEAFYHTPDITHVCAAGESLPLRAHSAAFAKYTEDKASGHTSARAKTQTVEDVRAGIALAWNAASANEIGFAPSVADGVSLIVESLHWDEGDNVVVDPDDFPSLIAPFVIKRNALRERVGGTAAGPEVRYAGVDDLEGAVDARTRVIVISYVSYLNAARVDLALYRKVADQVGAILIVDYSQAAGWAVIDATIADFAFSCCHKWLLGGTGTAIAYWNQTRQPGWRPATAGSHALASLPAGQPRHQWEAETPRLRDDAMVFSRGNPAHVSIYLLREGLEFLARWDTVRIQTHVQILTTSLRSALEREGIPSSTPSEKQRHGASVTVHCRGASDIVDEMRNLGVYAWNGNGRVRFSFHGYSCRADVERIMEVFPGLWGRYNG
ncbi:pyridoxal phosphate-dependent transferase [Aspergillus egyptiacus]|nr:pyridoxal phosphate-dependent transferase [Aspergillus egyptiacus]